MEEVEDLLCLWNWREGRLERGVNIDLGEEAFVEAEEKDRDRPDFRKYFVVQLHERRVQESKNRSQNRLRGPSDLTDFVAEKQTKLKQQLKREEMIQKREDVFVERAGRIMYSLPIRSTVSENNIVEDYSEEDARVHRTRHLTFSLKGHTDDGEFVTLPHLLDSSHLCGEHTFQDSTPSVPHQMSKAKSSKSKHENVVTIPIEHLRGTFVGYAWDPGRATVDTLQPFDRFYASPSLFLPDRGSERGWVLVPENWKEEIEGEGWGIPEVSPGDTTEAGAGRRFFPSDHFPLFTDFRLTYAERIQR